MGPLLLLCALLWQLVGLSHGASGPLKCGLGTKVCRDGLDCVLYSHLCDGEADCSDGSDEEDCATECSKDQFQCAHGRKCIVQSQVCDGTPQCQDRSDELGCTRRDEGCVHYCDNKRRCLPATFLCDGERDCIDGTDEADCVGDAGDDSSQREGQGLSSSTPAPAPPRLRCLLGSKPCRDNSSCVYYNHLCDGEVDCRDASDEDDCLTDCPADQFQCAHGKKCVDQAQVCDGVPQCQDRSDELSCSEHVEGCAHQCDDKSRCIPPSFLCDGERDCVDGSDEANCSGQACTLAEFSCSSGQCVSTSVRCDGHPDCWDHSDEDGCSSPLACPAAHRCPHSRECVLQEWLCDGDRDCRDGSDEKDCIVAPSTCGDFQWACKWRSGCVLAAWRCDGTRDCEDGSDELECGSVTCQPDEFQCGSQCVGRVLLCDGTPHCADGSDEGGKCLTACTVADEARCSHSCYSTPQGPWCGCASGLQLAQDGVTCVDVDECEQAGVCDQLCRNSAGSFMCSCRPGYMLQPDGRRCSVIEEAFLLASVEMDLFTLGLESGRLDMWSPAVTKPILALDYDWKEQKVFWVSLEMDSIGWSSLDKKATGTLIGGIRADSIAVDWLGRNLYWIDGVNSQIMAVGLRSASTAASAGPLQHSIILDEDLDQPRSLALLPQKGLMFWTEIGNVVKIERAGMDGSERTAVVNSSLGWPGGVAVDAVSERIYWTDERLRAIGSATLDGDNVRILQLRECTNPFALAVFGELLYWSDPRKRSVQAVHKVTGKNRRLVLKRPRQPFAVKVLHLVLQRASESPCGGLACAHLCVLAPGPRPVCKCHSGHLLAEDGLSCSSLVHSAFLLLLSPSTLTQVFLRGRHSAVSVRGWPDHVAMPVPGVNRASMLDLSLRELSVVLADEAASSLSSFTLREHVLVPRGQILRLLGDTISSIALDWITLSIYWSSTMQRRLLVTSSTGAYTAVLLRDNIWRLGSIAVHPPSGTLCFTNLERPGASAAVECANMDGSERRLVWENATRPTALVFSSTGEQIYWADTSSGVIGSVHVDGSEPKEFPVGAGLSGLALSDDAPLWLTLTDKARLWYRDEQQRHRLWFEVNTEVVGLKAFTRSSQAGSNSCSGDNGGCQQLCLPTPHSRTCGCAHDHVLLNITHCAPQQQCPTGSRLCLDQTSCQPAKKFCDGVTDCPDLSDENCVHLKQGDVPVAPHHPRSFFPPTSSAAAPPNASGPAAPGSNVSIDFRSLDTETCSRLLCSGRGSCVERDGDAACVCWLGYRGTWCQDHLLGALKRPAFYGLVGAGVALLLGVVLTVVLKMRSNNNSSRENPEVKETGMTDLESSKAEAAEVASVAD